MAPGQWRSGEADLSALSAVLRDSKVSDAASHLMASAFHAFEAAASLRIKEIVTSPPQDPGSDSSAFFVTVAAQPRTSGFAFALKGLAAVAPYVSEWIVDKLIRWLDTTVKRAEPDGRPLTEDENAVRLSAIKCVFCEALLATLEASPAGLNYLKLENLRGRIDEFFQSSRQQASLRRLVALDGRSEEALWVELVRALCQQQFESFRDRILNALDDTGIRYGPSKRRAIAPSHTAIAMCSALRACGYRASAAASAAAAAAARRGGRGGASGGGAAGASSAKLTIDFLDNIEKLLTHRAMRGLHKPICENLGSALLAQLLSDPGARATLPQEQQEPPPQEQRRLSSSAAASAPSPISPADAQRLLDQQVRLAEWATGKIGLPSGPRKLTARFESWAAPVATAFLCAACGGDGAGGAGGGGFSHGHTEERQMEMHARLLRKLLACLAQRDETAHRLVALRCLELQLPLLLRWRSSTQAGPSRETVHTIDAIFRGQGHAMRLSLDKERDAPPALRKYAELLHAHSSVALALADASFEWAIDHIVLRCLGERAVCSVSQESVLAFATFFRILRERPAAIGRADPWAANVRGTVSRHAGKLLQSLAHSPRLAENAQIGLPWLIYLHLLLFSMRCLRLLWPRAARAGGGLLQAAAAAAASTSAASTAAPQGGGVGVAGGAAGHATDDERAARDAMPSLDDRPNGKGGLEPGLLRILAEKICGTQRLAAGGGGGGGLSELKWAGRVEVQCAASELLATIVVAEGADVLPRALSALTDALERIPQHRPVRRREALQQITPLIGPWLEAPRQLRSLAPSLHRMLAFALVLLADPCPRLRGEAARLILLLAPIAHAAADPQAPDAAAYHHPHHHHPHHTHPQPSHTHRRIPALTRPRPPRPRPPRGGAAEGDSVAAVLVRALPSLAEAALADPCRWRSGSARRRRARPRGCARRRRRLPARLRRGVRQGGGRGRALAVLPHACVHELVRAASARSDSSCAHVLREAWPMLTGPFNSGALKVNPSAPLPPSWAAMASFACIAAALLLTEDTPDAAHRKSLTRVLVSAKGILLSDDESHRLAGVAVLGQLRGAACLHLVLSELATTINACREGATQLGRVTNQSSKVHVQMRQLSHVLCLLARQEEWTGLLTASGGPLGTLGNWLHSAVEYLCKDFNVHAYSHHLARSRRYVFELLACTTPALLTELRGRMDEMTCEGLRPGNVLGRVASLLEATRTDEARSALEAEKARTLVRYTQREAEHQQAALKEAVGRELDAQAEAVRVSALRALGALASPRRSPAARRRRAGAAARVRGGDAARWVARGRVGGARGDPPAVDGAPRDGADVAADRLPRALLRRAVRRDRQRALHRPRLGRTRRDAAVRPRVGRPRRPPGRRSAPPPPPPPPAGPARAPARARLAPRVGEAFPSVSAAMAATASLEAAAAQQSHRVSLMVLSLSKLSDPGEGVRSAASALLHALGGASNADAPSALLAEGLPWGAEHAQTRLSARLARSQPHLAAAVVHEALARASKAPPGLARLLLSFLSPWVEQAALMLLPARRGPAAQPNPSGHHSLHHSSSSGGGVGGGGGALYRTMMGALEYHSSKAQTLLAKPLHELWRALAASDAACLPPLVEALVDDVRTRVSPEALLLPRDAAAAVGAATALATMPDGGGHDAADEDGFEGGAGRSDAVLRACEAAILALSSVQPALCARTLAQHLAPAGCATPLAGEAGGWPADVTPEAIEDAVPTALAAAASPPIATFSAPPLTSTAGHPTAGAALALGGVRGGGAPPPPPRAASSSLSSSAAVDARYRCSKAEASLLLLSSCVDEALGMLIMDATAASATAPPPPPPPPPSGGPAARRLYRRHAFNCSRLCCTRRASPGRTGAAPSPASAAASSRAS